VPSDSAVPRRVARSGDAGIWLLDLDGADADPAAALALLSGDEQARAGRFVFDVHRRRFVTGRAALRTLLGERLGCAPRELRFAYGPAGKPALDGGGTTRFNVSHSDRYAIVAIATGAELGVDIERVRPLRDMDLVADRVFSARTLSIVAIYSALGLRDDAIGTQLAAALRWRPSPSVTRLTRRPHPQSETCFLHTPDWCLKA